MISETLIGASQAAQVSSTRAKTTSEESEARKGHDDVEDLIDLNVEAGFGEKLSNAKTEEDFLALLSEGQAQAQVSLDKFRALLDTGLLGEGADNNQDFNSVVFNAVKDVVVDILMAQNDPSKKSSNSFDLQLSMKLRENAPEFMEQYEKSQANPALAGVAK